MKTTLLVILSVLLIACNGAGGGSTNWTEPQIKSFTVLGQSSNPYRSSKCENTSILPGSATDEYIYARVGKIS